MSEVFLVQAPNCRIITLVDEEALCHKQGLEIFLVSNKHYEPELAKKMAQVYVSSGETWKKEFVQNFREFIVADDKWYQKAKDDVEDYLNCMMWYLFS